MGYDLIVHGARLVRGGGQPVRADVAVADGRIAAIGDLQGAEAARSMDAQGMLMLPPLVETHIHLDTALTAGQPRWNESGSLFEGIAIWSERKKELTKGDVLRRALETVKILVSHGVLAIRALADISDPKLTALSALLELKEKLAPVVELQVAAFPQDGLWSAPANRDRMEEALRMGADAVSAVPHLEHSREDGVASLAYVFELAERSGAYVHLFADELDDPHSRFLETAAAMAIASGLRSQVAAAHASASAYYPEAYFRKLLGLLAESQIHIVSCPLINTAMQGRFDPPPKGRGVARLKELLEAGVNVAVSHDDLRSPFYPLGSGNPLQAAHMAVHAAHMTGRSELREAVAMVTGRAAKVMGLDERFRFEEGASASFVLFGAEDEADLLSRQPPCRYVFSKGLVVAETPAPKTVWHTELGGALCGNDGHLLS
ncbi:amidohydrolase family protein [Paenibacillus turpanensis]|uniref:amidohydrolase family protein n=1 Tax=Paenibacillus turpanensis TaxID=2689078 RepID=UPI00140A4197|nr:amidohydrolase family protein [Paenibacillus turpanensis]